MVLGSRLVEHLTFQSKNLLDRDSIRRLTETHIAARLAGADSAHLTSLCVERDYAPLPPPPAPQPPQPRLHLRRQIMQCVHALLYGSCAHRLQRNA